MLRKKGYTLVELLIVMFIVAILASISIFIMGTTTKRARASEAVAALGAIRTQMRGLYVRNQDYTNDGRITPGCSVVGNVSGFPEGDLTGAWFFDENYTIESVTSDSFVAQCVGDPSIPAVAGFVITIDQDGNVTQSY